MRITGAATGLPGHLPTLYSMSAGHVAIQPEAADSVVIYEFDQSANRGTGTGAHLCIVNRPAATRGRHRQGREWTPAGAARLSVVVGGPHKVQPRLTGSEPASQMIDRWPRSVMCRREDRLIFWSRWLSALTPQAPINR